MGLSQEQHFEVEEVEPGGGGHVVIAVPVQLGEHVAQGLLQLRFCVGSDEEGLQPLPSSVRCEREQRSRADRSHVR